MKMRGGGEIADLSLFFLPLPSPNRVPPLPPFFRADGDKEKLREAGWERDQLSLLPPPPFPSPPLSVGARSSLRESSDCKLSANLGQAIAPFLLLSFSRFLMLQGFLSPSPLSSPLRPDRGLVKNDMRAHFSLFPLPLFLFEI